MTDCIFYNIVNIMKNEKTSAGNFFQNLFSSLFGSNDPNAEKKKKLKAINKRLSKSKFNKYYKHTGNEATPLLAKLFFDLYKAISPAQVMFESINNPNILKKIVISSALTEEQKQIEESISEDNIIKLSKEIPLDRLKEQVDAKISHFNDNFTADKISTVDLLYKQLIAFRDFCTYDFYFLLKKFDKGMQERNFAITPRFEKINAEYISDDLKDFISVAWTIPFNTDWTALINLLRNFKGVEPVTLNLWKKIIAKLQAIKQSEAFEMIIQLASEDPFFTPNIQLQTFNIVEPYLDSLRNDSYNIIQKLQSQELQSKTSSILEQLFGNAPVVQLKYYTESKSQALKAKSLPYFNYCNALGYLKAFLIEIVKKDLRNYYDLVIVRGKWDSPTLCSPFSNAYHSLLAVADQITKFDEEIAEDKPIGMKIKNLMTKADRDNGARNIITRIVGDVNETANDYILDSLRNIVTIGKSIKNLIEDEGKQKPEIVSNWRELEHYSDTPLREFSVSLYKKIYLFTTLIQANTKQEQ